MNSLSQTLGLETGPSIALSTGGSINASSGSLDANGNRVFTVTSVSFANGSFTINGGPNDFVVLNLAGNLGNLNGGIVLTGGIPSDQVLINLTPPTSNLTNYNNAYATLSGGPTLNMSTNGGITSAIFLDPTGNLTIDNTTVFGRIIGGDSQNGTFVSGSKLTAPTPVPEPWGLTLLATAAVGSTVQRWRRNQRRNTLAQPCWAPCKMHFPPPAGRTATHATLGPPV
jgi:hypothetical protein